jgi:glutamate dehydrogenase/leucine dehydrogenase/CBS domain-containing protein
VIPQNMRSLLDAYFPKGMLQNRVARQDGQRHLELNHRDEKLLNQLGIASDELGPFLVVLMWDEASDLEIGGYLVVDNLSMGAPTIGGIRMLPSLELLDVYNLARGMTLKSGAANLPHGGGKSGIVVPDRQLSAQEHELIIRGFARLLKRYQHLYVPGPDVGTNDNDMKTIAIENGLDAAMSKPAEMGGTPIDELGAAAGGVITALAVLLNIMPRLKVLPQFSNMVIPSQDEVTVLFQGFGAVGANAAKMLKERLPKAKTIGISDADGYLYDPAGLPVDELFHAWQQHGLVTKAYFQQVLADQGRHARTKFSSDNNNLLREKAFCLIPAAPVFNYLGVDLSEEASMTIDRMGQWQVIIEAANTYSPDPNRRAQRTRMEQRVYLEKGILIASDYLVNSGGVIFAAQDHLIPTPDHLQLPEHILGNREAVDAWLHEHAEAFEALSAQRQAAGEAWREDVIRTNMVELVTLLAANPHMLPSQAAERVSLRRLTEREKIRTAKDIMMPVASVKFDAPIQEAAIKIVEGDVNLAVVLGPDDKLVGVITAWDLTQAIARTTSLFDMRVDHLMIRQSVSVAPHHTVLQVLNQLEENRVSAVPVVEDGYVLGMINADLLAHWYLPHLLKAD